MKLAILVIIFSALSASVCASNDRQARNDAFRYFRFGTDLLANFATGSKLVKVLKNFLLGKLEKWVDSFDLGHFTILLINETPDDVQVVCDDSPEMSLNFTLPIEPSDYLSLITEPD